jgi:hypothetical protein
MRHQAGQILDTAPKRINFFYRFVNGDALLDLQAPSSVTVERAMPRTKACDSLEAQRTPAKHHSQAAPAQPTQKERATAHEHETSPERTHIRFC